MELWRYILEADRKEDLADASRATDWFCTAEERYSRDRFGVTYSDGHSPLAWHEVIVRTWRRALHALRDVAGRVKQFRGRRGDIESVKADGVWQRYVARLVPTLYERYPGGREKPLGPESFKGICLMPNAALQDDASQIDSLDQVQRDILLRVEFFWQRAFASLLGQDLWPHACCRICGSDLARTPKGHVSRAELCARCRRAEWERSLKPKDRRERWKRNKNKQRAKNNKAAPTTKSKGK